MKKYKDQRKLIFEHRWGTLIILDACRYDYFRDVSGELDLKGDLGCCDTHVTGTAQWYYRIWCGPEGATTITLVTANPWGLRYPLIFDRIIRAWDAGADCTKVDPDRTMDFYRRYAMGKKTVIHFTPPHSPYLTEYGKALYKRADIEIEKMGGTDWDDRENFKALYNTEKALAAYGRGGHWEEVKEAYRDNLRFILRKIIGWLPEFRAPVIITADHGEVVSEGGPGGKGGYGHCHGQENVKWVQRLVPWFVCAGDDEITRRLKALGYVD